MNQKRLRQEDTALMGVTYIPDHQNIYLPASFLGSNKWASKQIADSLAIAAAYGPPTFFITFTCNTDWPEIHSQLLPGQDFRDILTVVIQVFCQKLTALESTLKTMFPNAGHLLYMVHSIEFQKRGVPHCVTARYYSCNHAATFSLLTSSRRGSDGGCVPDVGC